MDLIANNTKAFRNNNQDVFFMLLKNLKIEEAIERCIDDNIEINYNSKQRCIPKITWIKYLKKTILNKFTKVVQFKVEKMINQNEESSFKIFMICKKINGTLDFTEIRVTNNWEGNSINKLQYKLISH